MTGAAPDIPGPQSDAAVPAWLRELGLPGLVDLHTHFLPERVLRKVWAFFDEGRANYGMDWPIQYRYDEPTRVEVLDDLGVRTFAPLVYPHKPGMAEWLNEWVREFAERTPAAVITGTVHPEPGAQRIAESALAGGARCFKMHVPVGSYDPRDPLLDGAWGVLADAGVPVVVHCGHAPRGSEFSGLDVFSEVLARHPRLTAVLAHAAMPEYEGALDLVRRYPRVHVDTTMVGVAFAERYCGALPEDWSAQLADLGDRVVLGTDFPNIPYPYAEQLAAIADWARAEPRLGAEFLRAVLHDNPARLLGVS